METLLKPSRPADLAVDVIGDIHGQAQKLEALLRQLGYRERNGAWQHPGRRALFVGDFIDRGPEQVRTLEIVRAMMQAGQARAVMGNHEFNAIAFAFRDPSNPDRHLRVRSEKNRHQHARFLEEVGEDSAAHQAWIEWFLTLPLWIETEQLRAVHACWHPTAMAHLQSKLAPGQCLTQELMVEASRPESSVFDAVEVLCKGLEVALPAGVSYRDAEGNHRTRSRVAWWDEQATTYRAATLVGAAARAQLPEEPLPPQVRLVYDEAKPLFFGHYWMQGQPKIFGRNRCCVDYSAARPDQPLAAYCFTGERRLSPERFALAHSAPTAPRMRP